MKFQFSQIVLFVGILMMLAIYFLHLNGLVIPANELYIRFLLMGVFIISIVLIILKSSKKLKLFSKDVDKGHNIVTLSLTFLLLTSILDYRLGAYATGTFIGAALIYFLLNKKLYRLNKIYFSLFLYVVLMTLGTIGTIKCFRFPDASLSFLLLPMAYSLFRLNKETFLNIAYIFFKGLLIYLAICVVYWWFNFLSVDVTFFRWITHKLFIDGSKLIGWSEQIRLSSGTTFPAFYFVTSWAYFYHPSYISLVLLLGLVTGFYLYHKKPDFPTVTKFELSLYIILCLLIIILMESRIGFVGLAFILCLTSLYYFKLKTKYFKIMVLIYMVVGSTAFIGMHGRIESFMDDNVRKTDYTLAVNYIKDHFWWGIGFDEQHIALEQEEQLMKDVLPPVGNIKTYTHNQFLGNMVQYGIVGLIVLLIVLVTFLRYSIKSKSYLLQLFMLIIILFMTIEEPLYGQKGITIFSVFLTFFVAVGESDKFRQTIDFKKNNKI